MASDETADPTATNIERLRGHLEDDSLGAKLVDTYQSSEPDKRADALKAVAEARLTEILAELAAKDTANASN